MVRNRVVLIKMAIFVFFCLMSSVLFAELKNNVIHQYNTFYNTIIIQSPEEQDRIATHNGYVEMARKQQEKERFVAFTDLTYGYELGRKIDYITTGSERGGAILQYMAEANADIIGVSKEELKSSPSLAIRKSITRNVGEIAYSVYDEALQQGASREDAIKQAGNIASSLIDPAMENEKGMRKFIASFAGSDKTGDVFVNAGMRYETSLTGINLGNAGTAFLEIAADSFIVGRAISKIINGEGLSFDHSLKARAINENLNGDDPMLSSFMKTVATIVGWILHIILAGLLLWLFIKVFKL